MQAFKTLKGRAAPLPIVNIDTDMIIPKEFLKTIKRTGLGVSLFNELRRDINGNEIASFVLNKPAYRKAQILVTGENFGCGSSREHAPWSILDFGIRAIIASSYADIFYNNCFKNGILPIKLSESQVSEIMKFAEDESNEVEINLDAQEVRTGSKIYKFEIDRFRKYCLYNGFDDIGLTLQKEEQIKNYEQTRKAKYSWFESAAQ
jgi:3-isopropylmalate/(R)-2-methylmalate dehydratase small subunit